MFFRQLAHTALQSLGEHICDLPSLRDYKGYGYRQSQAPSTQYAQHNLCTNVQFQDLPCQENAAKSQDQCHENPTPLTELSDRPGRTSPYIDKKGGHGSSQSGQKDPPKVSPW
jgi:hypothetical protein